MAIEVIEYKGEFYPKFESEGNFMQYLIPFAKKICIGSGLDIGVKNKEWAYPGAWPIDIEFNELDENGKLIEAYNLPTGEYDYIISSHCLEHLPNWVGALDYWSTKLKKGGSLCLYLPHPDSKYWLPFNNMKHIHSLSPSLLLSYLVDRSLHSDMWVFNKIFVSGCDINHSFIVMAEKK